MFLKKFARNQYPITPPPQAVKDDENNFFSANCAESSKKKNGFTDLAEEINVLKFEGCAFSLPGSTQQDVTINAPVPRSVSASPTFKPRRYECTLPKTFPATPPPPSQRIFSTAPRAPKRLITKFELDLEKFKHIIKTHCLSPEEINSYEKKIEHIHKFLQQHSGMHDIVDGIKKLIENLCDNYSYMKKNFEQLYKKILLAEIAQNSNQFIKDNYNKITELNLEKIQIIYNRIKEKQSNITLQDENYIREMLICHSP